jgi:hypothetical protein
VRQYAEVFRQALPDARALPFNPNPDALVLRTFISISSALTNVTLWASDRPPPWLSPEALARIQPPAYCNSSGPAPPVPEAVRRNIALNPLYVLQEGQAGLADTVGGTGGRPVCECTVCTFFPGDGVFFGGKGGGG